MFLVRLHFLKSHTVYILYVKTALLDLRPAAAPKNGEPALMTFCMQVYLK